jgi:long-subunit fatty acid transport protein
MLSVGANYKFSDKFSGQIGYHTYFDKGTGWSEIEDPENPARNVSVIDKNYWELGLGFEYSVNEKLLLSLGYLRAQTGVNDYYQSDMSYSLSSNTFGLGGAYMLNDMITLNLGGYYTMYTDATAKMSPNTPFSQTYKKSNYAFAIGLDLAFGGK